MNVSFLHSQRPVIIEKSSSVTLSCVCVSLRSSTSLSAWLLFSFSLLFFCWSFSFLWVADIYVIIAYPHSTHIQLHGLQWWRSVAGQFPFSRCWIKNMSFSCSYKTRNTLIKYPVSSERSADKISSLSTSTSPSPTDKYWFFYILQSNALSEDVSHDVQICWHSSICPNRKKRKAPSVVIVHKWMGAWTEHTQPSKINIEATRNAHNERAAASVLMVEHKM